MAGVFPKLLREEVIATWHDDVTHEIYSIFEELSLFVSTLKSSNQLTEEIGEQRKAVLLEIRSFVGPDVSKHLVFSFFDAADALFHWKRGQPYQACRLLRQSQQRDELLIREAGLTAMALHKYQTCQNYTEVLFKCERFKTALALSADRATGLSGKLHSIKSLENSRGSSQAEIALLLDGSIAESVVRFDQWTSRSGWRCEEFLSEDWDGFWIGLNASCGANGFARLFVASLQASVSGSWKGLNRVEPEDWSSAFSVAPSSSLILSRNMLKLLVHKMRNGPDASGIPFRLQDTIQNIYELRVTGSHNEQNRAGQKL
ncbi:MAG: hypothetical protein ABJP79_12465 [Tateyamaria sp.]|uniref:hypothetical protein n=1 Tax=Tateyamaria sp. TaxID=1929288 RepID=UPI00329EFCA8